VTVEKRKSFTAPGATGFDVEDRAHVISNVVKLILSV
jgi:hypothetical protein